MPHLTRLMYLVVVAGWCVSIGLAPTAHAQQETEQREQFEPTEEQQQLNRDGVEALVEEEYARAVALLTEAYRLGEGNILALNLGRAYHQLGQCESARRYLERVPRLPVIDSPPPERVEQTAEQYLAEVEESCSESSDTGSESEESETTAESETGGESETGDASDGDGSSTPDEEDGESQTASVEPPGDEPGIWTRYRRRFGQIGVGVGVGSAVSGLILHLIARDRRADINARLQSEESFENGVNTEVTQREVQRVEAGANRLDTIALIAAITGGVVGTAGAALWWYDEQNAESHSAFGFSLVGDEMHLHWSLRF